MPCGGYLRVTIICRYISVILVQSTLSVLIFVICTQIWYRIKCSVIQIVNICECKILHFWANPQKY